MTDEALTPNSTRVDVKLATSDGELAAWVVVPNRPARVDELVPAAQDLTDGIVELAVLQAEKAGEKVSCRAGCSACCAQLVPVSEPEAFALADLVADLPEARRRRVLARFAEAIGGMEDAGLLETLRNPPPTDAEHREMARAYFELGQKCPFLEDDRCGIHPDRPLACRELNVLTPAERCKSPFDTPVDKVPIPLRMTTVMARVAARLSGRAPANIPLILSLEWASRHGDHRGPKMPGVDLLKLLLENIDNARVSGY